MTAAQLCECTLMSLSCALNMVKWQNVTLGIFLPNQIFFFKRSLSSSPKKGDIENPSLTSGLGRQERPRRPGQEDRRPGTGFPNTRTLNSEPARREHSPRRESLRVGHRGQGPGKEWYFTWALKGEEEFFKGRSQAETLQVV